MFTLRATIYSVVALLSTIDIASGQQPKRADRDPLPILPAEQAWIVTLPSPTSAGGAMDAERIYVPLQSEALTALDRQTGAILWVRSIESAWPPVLHDGVVYLAASDELHALDPLTGESIWRVPLGRALAAPLVFDTGWLIAVGGTGDVEAFRAADGQRLWTQSLGAAPRSPAVAGDDDAIYFTLADGRVVSIDLRDGSSRWSQQLPGMLSEPAAAEGRVFVGSTDNFFYALAADTGDVEWKWRSGGDVNGAAADGELVFITSLDNIIRAVNRGNGNQRWRKATGSRPVIPPRAVAGVVIVSGIAKSLTAFSARTGEQVGTYVAPSDLQGPPLIDPRLRPFRVAAAVVMRDGRVAGFYPVAMLFRDHPLVPLAATLPGRTLQRERLPAPSRTGS
ncbi:MAG TPA: PQQ-binding-like beta-propeller repeat protein [Vicinamibacterales bacterium]